MSMSIPPIRARFPHELLTHKYSFRDPSFCVLPSVSSPLRAAIVSVVSQSTVPIVIEPYRLRDVARDDETLLREIEDLKAALSSKEVLNGGDLSTRLLDQFSELSRGVLTRIKGGSRTDPDKSSIDYWPGTQSVWIEFDNVIRLLSLRLLEAASSRAEAITQQSMYFYTYYLKQLTGPSFTETLGAIRDIFGGGQVIADTQRPMAEGTLERLSHLLKSPLSTWGTQEYIQVIQTMGFLARSDYAYCEGPLLKVVQFNPFGCGLFLNWIRDESLAAYQYAQRHATMFGSTPQDLEALEEQYRGQVKDVWQSESAKGQIFAKSKDILMTAVDILGDMGGQRALSEFRDRLLNVKPLMMHDHDIYEAMAGIRQSMLQAVIKIGRRNPGDGLKDRAAAVLMDVLLHPHTLEPERVIAAAELVRMGRAGYRVQKRDVIDVFTEELEKYPNLATVPHHPALRRACVQALAYGDIDNNVRVAKTLFDLLALIIRTDPDGGVRYEAMKLLKFCAMKPAVFMTPRALNRFVRECIQEELRALDKLDPGSVRDTTINRIELAIQILPEQKFFAALPLLRRLIFSSIVPLEVSRSGLEAIGRLITLGTEQLRPKDTTANHRKRLREGLGILIRALRDPKLGRSQGDYRGARSIIINLPRHKIIDDALIQCAIDMEWSSPVKFSLLDIAAERKLFGDVAKGLQRRQDEPFKKVLKELAGEVADKVEQRQKGTVEFGLNAFLFEVSTHVNPGEIIKRLRGQLFGPKKSKPKAKKKS